MHTEAINHDPAITFFQTGSQLPGRPSMGAWIDYGLGSSNQNLPAFVVLHSVASEGTAGQGLLARLWGAGFLPSRHQGVQFRANGDPVLYLTDSPGMTRERRRTMFDGAAALNKLLYQRVGDPEIETRIEQCEMAYRMQASVPELMDVSGEPESIYDLYGPDSRKPGTFAANCLLARRLAERDVRFIQLYHRGWDHHGDIPKRLPVSARDTDQPSAALVKDLKQRGLLEDTLVVWAGEFGRTPYAQGDPKAREVRKGPPRTLFLDLDGRCGRQAGPCSRRDGRIRVQYRGGSGSHLRRAGDDSAPARHRPREACVPVPRTPAPFDGHGRTLDTKRLGLSRGRSPGRPCFRRVIADAAQMSC